MQPRVFAAAVAAFLLLALAQPVQARSLKHHGHHLHRITHHVVLRSHGCPPNLGCGCNLANRLGGIARFGEHLWRQLWVARNWSREGEPAHRGCIGCVAVLSRGRGGHVGVVKGYDANGNPIIHSYANARLGWTTTSYSARRVLAYRQL